MATNFPSGVASNGTALVPSGGGGGVVVGNVFYVGNLSTVPSTSVAGVDDPSYGTSPQRPFKTINYASTKCTANNGDVIYVLPGHTESITAAGGITCGIAGVTIEGLGSGSARPAVTLSTATTATFKVTAANVTVKNIYFDGTGIDAIAKIFDVQAAGFKLDGCEVYFAKSGAVALKGLVTSTQAAGNNLAINNCYIHGDAAANCTNFVQLIGGDSIKITNTVIMGNFTTSLGAVNNITNAVTNIVIDNCRFSNSTASSTKCIVLLTGSTGWVTNNRLGILSGTAPITADATYWEGNYYAAAAATAGTLV